MPKKVETGPIVGTVSSADGVMIHYEMVGKGEPTLIFVHGWSCDRSYWKNQVDEFSKTHRVVTIDLAGHGESGLERDNWTIDAFGADVAAVIKKLNLDQVVLLGHSFAGSVIIQTASQLPGRIIGLIGVDTYHNLEMDLTPDQIEAAAARFKGNFAASIEEYVRKIFAKKTDTVLVNKVASDMSSAPPEIAINVIENYLSINPVDLLKELNIPIRAINAMKPTTNLEDNQKYASSFEVKYVPDVGHFVQLEDPVTFNRLLHETINELTGKSHVPVEKE